MPNISSNPTTTGFDPTVLYNDLQQVKDQAKTSLQQALTNLGVVLAGGAGPGGATGAMSLTAPNASILGNVSDMTLRIGLLQDALNELMTQVSKLEIDKRMNEMQNNNKEELNQIKKQMKEAEEAYKKQQEANQKGNIFEMIGDWISVAFDFVSVIVTAASAIAYAASGNYVAAAAMIAATAAMIGSLACNITLAIDSTLKATGNEGFLSDKQRGNLKLAAQILGYVAMACALIGGVAAITQGLSQAATVASKEMAKQGMQASKTAIMKEVLAAAASFFKDGLKEGVKSGTKEASRELVKQALAKALKPLMEYTARMAMTNAIRAGVQNVNTGISGHLVADLKEAAADAQLRADEAAAKAKAISAQIAMLKALIEQLQEELGDMMESAMNSVSAIYGAIDESQQSMENLFHTQAA